MNKIEYWSVEDTGWSGSSSWFATGGTWANPIRFDSKEKAFKAAKKSKKECTDTQTQWRVVHTTIERTEDKETIINQWIKI